MWESSQFPVTEITAWVILAGVLSMGDEVADAIWSQEQQHTINTRIMRDLDSNKNVQDLSGGWAPIQGVPPGEVRTYSTTMALWSELTAIAVPRVKRFIGDRYKSSIYRALIWFQNDFGQDLGGWVPKPSRPHQTRRYPALTAQILCVLSLAERDPDFAFVKNWEQFKQAKHLFISNLNERIRNLGSIPDDQIETQDQAVPPAIELEGSTFLAFPWTLTACQILKADSSLSTADQKRAGAEETRLRALLRGFNDHLLNGSTQTYEIAEGLAALQFPAASFYIGVNPTLVSPAAK